MTCVCVHLYVHTCVCLSVCLSDMSVCLSVNLSVCLYYVCTDLSVCMYACMHVLRTIYKSSLLSLGDCDWSTACSNNAVCFWNSTGCPVSGAYTLTTTTTTPCTSPLDCPTHLGLIGEGLEGGGEGSFDAFTYSFSAGIGSLVVLGASVVLLAVICVCSRRQHAKEKARYG